MFRIVNSHQGMPIDLTNTLVVGKFTVANETLEGVFLPNNSMNIHHRTLKPSAMCFY